MLFGGPWWWRPVGTAIGLAGAVALYLYLS